MNDRDYNIKDHEKYERSKQYNDLINTSGKIIKVSTNVQHAADPNNNAINIEDNLNDYNKYIDIDKINNIVNKYQQLRKIRLLSNKGIQSNIENKNKYLRCTNPCSSFHVLQETMDCENIECCSNTDTIDYGNLCHNKNIFNKNIENMYIDKAIQNLSEKSYSDKTTYCRPIINYNQAFIYKTMEKNTRLKKLVKKLIMLRQQENDNVLWNNYINNLKNKHGLKNNNMRNSILIEPQEPVDLKTIKDYYNTHFNCKQSTPCKDLLQDLNSTYTRQHYDDQNTKVSKNLRINRNIKYPIFDNDSYCFPTCSQGRLIAIEREKQRRDHLYKWQTNSTERHLNNKAFTSKSLHKNNQRIIENNEFNNERLGNFKSTIMQTDVNLDPEIKNINSKHKDKSVAAIIKNYTIDNDKILTVNQDRKKSLKCRSVLSIEAKLETLTNSINTFINELKLNRIDSLKNNSSTKTVDNLNNFNKLNTVQNLSYKNIIKRSTASDGISESYNAIYSNDKPEPDNLTKKTSISLENIGNTNSNGREYQNKDCFAELQHEIPTRDCCTEVSNSFSKNQNIEKSKEISYKTVEEQIAQDDLEGSMTVAINTDPLSLVALLKISSDTLKSILSCVPSVDYSSFVSMLHLPKFHLYDSSCNCDLKALDVYNHMHKRYCCVCQDLLCPDTKGPFKCKHCGRSFSRAYCWELHQLSCKKRLRTATENSNLMILK